LEKEPEAWTIRIVEDEPELFGYDFDVGAGSGAEQVSASLFHYDTAGATFGNQEINCALCHETFEDREDLLGHLHLSHAMVYSELCDCMVCSGRKLSGLPFHGDMSLEQPFELTGAQAGASETERHDSVCEDTAMDIDDDSEFQDNLTNPGADDESPVEEAEPAEAGTYQRGDDIDFSAFEAAFIGADYDQGYFDYLDEGRSV
jgi:hypothetical protein